jgi:hypothetical protein
MLEKPSLLGVAFLLATAIVANAEPQDRPSMDPQVSAVPTPMMMPEGRAPHPQSWYFDPYAGGLRMCAQTHRHSATKCKYLIPLSSW